MSGNGAIDPALVRCTACVEIRCTVFCGKDAIVPVCGDILVEMHKCVDCEHWGGSRIPECIASCLNAEEKWIAGDESPEQKQIKAALALP
jgi:hypothetical protein